MTETPREPEAPGDEAAPGTPSTGEDVCPRCGGSGRVEGGEGPACRGTGRGRRGGGGGGPAGAGGRGGSGGAWAGAAAQAGRRPAPGQPRAGPRAAGPTTPDDVR